MDEDIKSLIEKNTKLVQTVYEQNRKIKRRLTLMVVGSYIRLSLIILPIILAIIFLPPMVEKIWAQYGGMLRDLGAITGQGSTSSQTQLQAILNQLGVGR